MKTGKIYHTIAYKTKWATDLCIGLLLLYCYYQALQKCLAYDHYRFWLSNAPVIKAYSKYLSVIIPALLVCVAGLLLWCKSRSIALMTIILMQIIFIAWVAYVIYGTPFIFWPYHSIIGTYNWVYKFFECLIVAWLAYTCYRQQTTAIIPE